MRDLLLFKQLSLLCNLRIDLLPKVVCNMMLVCWFPSELMEYGVCAEIVYDEGKIACFSIA